jgi:YTH domain-containing family protein
LHGMRALHSAYANGQQRTATTNHFPFSTFSGNGSSK